MWLTVQILVTSTFCNNRQKRFDNFQFFSFFGIFLTFQIASKFLIRPFPPSINWGCSNFHSYFLKEKWCPFSNCLQKFASNSCCQAVSSNWEKEKATLQHWRATVVAGNDLAPPKNVLSTAVPITVFPKRRRAGGKFVFQFSPLSTNRQLAAAADRKKRRSWQTSPFGAKKIKRGWFCCDAMGRGEKDQKWRK